MRDFRHTVSAFRRTPFYAALRQHHRSSASTMVSRMFAATILVNGAAYAAGFGGVCSPTTEYHPLLSPCYADALTGVRLRSPEDTPINGASPLSRVARMPVESFRLREDFLVDEVITGNGTPYDVRPGGLIAGATVYMDRPYRFASVPELLRGAAHVFTANNDKYSPEAQTFLRFSVNKSVTVYVLYDDRYGSRPPWLHDFADTELDVLVDEGAALVNMSAYVKDFPPGPIVLGGNYPVSTSASNSMYVVAVVEQNLDIRDIIVPSGYDYQFMAGGRHTGLQPGAPAYLNSRDDVYIEVPDFIKGAPYIMTEPLDNPFEQIQFTTNKPVVVYLMVSDDSLGTARPGSIPAGFKDTYRNVAIEYLDSYYNQFRTDHRSIYAKDYPAGDVVIPFPRPMHEHYGIAILPRDGRVYSLTTADYEIVPFGLHAGMTVNADESATYVGIPSAISGATLIRPVYDSNYVTAIPHLGFAINNPATVVVLYDNNASASPSLPDGFTDTGWTVWIDALPDPISANVYARNYPAGGVSLFGYDPMAKELEPDAMHGVAVVPLEVHNPDGVPTYTYLGSATPRDIFARLSPPTPSPENSDVSFANGVTRRILAIELRPPEHERLTSGFAIPPGLDLMQNIKYALAMRSVGFKERMEWFYSQVRAGAAWDYKRLGGYVYEDFGNFHFGLMGAAADIPASILLRGAGWGQLRTGTSKDEWGHWLDMRKDSSYGDDPLDQFFAKMGIEFFEKISSGTSPVVSIGTATLLADEYPMSALAWRHMSETLIGAGMVLTPYDAAQDLVVGIVQEASDALSEFIGRLPSSIPVYRDMSWSWDPDYGVIARTREERWIEREITDDMDLVATKAIEAIEGGAQYKLINSHMTTRDLLDGQPWWTLKGRNAHPLYFRDRFAHIDDELIQIAETAITSMIRYVLLDEEATVQYNPIANTMHLTIQSKRPFGTEPKKTETKRRRGGSCAGDCVVPDFGGAGNSVPPELGGNTGPGDSLRDTGY